MSYFDERKSSNPIIQKYFSHRVGEISHESMTLEGVLNKVGFSTILLLLSACYGWVYSSFSLVLIGAFGGLALALLTIFKKTWASFTVPLYALFEGLFLGALSALLENIFPGIVSQAILITLLILGLTLGAYRSGYLKATPRFRKMVYLGTSAIFLMYLLNFVLGLFGSGLPMINSSSWFGIALSLFIVGIASLNLVLDFDFIENAVSQGLPRHMEWYAAFSLLVTIIWLYVEVLRLLEKLRGNK